MNNEKVRAVLAIIVVSGVILVSGLLALIPVLSGFEADRAKAYLENAETFAGVFSGVVGLILGYYFGKKD